MGRRHFYKPGRFYRVDDRSGFTVAAERTQKEWDGSIVADGLWEPRHPQDFVRGIRDDQSVPDARPPAPDTFVGPIAASLSASAAPKATTIVVSDITGFLSGDTLRVVLDDGSLFSTTAQAVGVNGVVITTPLPRGASAGNLVYDMGPGNVAGTREFVFQGAGGSFLVQGSGDPFDWSGQ